MGADFQGPKFEISAQELEGMNMVFQCPPVILVNKCCMFLVKLRLPSLIFTPAEG